MYFCSAIRGVTNRYLRFIPLATSGLSRTYSNTLKCRVLNHSAKVLSFPSITQTRRGGDFKLPYTLSHLEERILLVLKLYDKVNPDTLKLESHFYNDLGLDSLDHVEIVVAMEEEFGFEIPEEHHQRLMRPKDIVRYVADRFDIYE